MNSLIQALYSLLPVQVLVSHWYAYQSDICIFTKGPRYCEASFKKIHVKELLICTAYTYASQYFQYFDLKDKFVMLYILRNSLLSFRCLLHCLRNMSTEHPL
jgi:hypothetical protein